MLMKDFNWVIGEKFWELTILSYIENQGQKK